MSRQHQPGVAGLCEFLVLDQPEPCPYLPGRTARLPFRLPSRSLNGTELDTRLAEGDRRFGNFLYQPHCSACRECEPIRLRVADFRPNRSQRRAWRRGVANLTVSLGSPRVDDERRELYRRHKRDRGLGDEGEISTDAYRSFLVDSCATTFEIRYEHHGALVAVAITDRAANSLSAVYTYFDPRCSAFSLGTFSALTQVQLCRSWDLEWLYLGYHIAGNSHMRYKSRFRPHERRRDGEGWQRFD